MTTTATAITVTEAQFEEACEAFADAPGRKADASLSGVDSAREVPYSAIPEGSKDWYRLRMYAAFATLGITVDTE